MAGKFGNLPGAGPGRPKGSKNGAAAARKNAAEAKKLAKKLERMSKDAINLAFEKTAPKISEYFSAAYLQAINFFYTDYTPEYYERTYALKSPVRKYVNVIAGGHGAIDAGVIVSPDYYPPGFLYYDPFQVLPAAFESGFHGRKEVKVMKPTPKSIMDSYFKQYTEQNKPFRHDFKNYTIPALIDTYLPWAMDTVSKSGKYK